MRGRGERARCEERRRKKGWREGRPTEIEVGKERNVERGKGRERGRETCRKAERDRQREREGGRES